MGRGQDFGRINSVVMKRFLLRYLSIVDFKWAWVDDAWNWSDEGD